MSYSPEEFVENVIARLAFAKELAERYPEAYKSCDRWFSMSLTRADCDVVEVVPGSNELAVLMLGKRLASGGVVYRSGFISPVLPPFPEGALLEALLAYARTKDY